MAQNPAETGGPHLSVTQARQARRGMHAFWILAVSVILAVIALAALWAVFSPGFEHAQSQITERQAAAANAPPTTSP